MRRVDWERLRLAVIIGALIGLFSAWLALILSCEEHTDARLLQSYR